MPVPRIPELDHRAAKLRRLRDIVLDGPGTVGTEVRHAAASGEGVPEALAGYVFKVHRRAYEVSDEDVDELRRAGYTDDQIFEVTVSAALGAALTRLQAGLGAVGVAAEGS